MKGYECFVEYICNKHNLPSVLRKRYCRRQNNKQAKIESYKYLTL